MQDELKRVDSKLATTSAELEVATNQVDAIAKATKVLETKNMIDEGRKLKLFDFVKRKRSTKLPQTINFHKKDF